MSFSIIVKSCVGILIGITLNLQIAFGHISIFTLLILLIHEHESFFHLLISSSTSLFNAFKFSSYKSFDCLMRFTPRYFYIIWDYCENGFFPDFFLSLFVICIEEGYWFLWVNPALCWKCLSDVGVSPWNFLGLLCILSYHLQIRYFDFFFTSLYLLDLLQLTYCSS